MSTTNVFSFDQPLSQVEQVNLRSSGAMNENEVAVRSGDLLVAVNSLTGERRRLSNDATLSE